MDERLLRREKEERPILSAVGAGNLCNTIGHSFLSLSSSDKNQNLLEEEVEGEDNVELLQGGRELFQLDSVNNNEEMDNMTNPINWDTWHKDSSTANTQQSTETGVLGDCPAVCPLTGKSSALHLEGSSKIANASCPTSPIALLKELQEDGDHPWLPQRLHQILVEHLKTSHTLALLHYFSDGAAAQYKNYKNFCNLLHELQKLLQPATP